MSTIEPDPVATTELAFAEPKVTYAMLAEAHAFNDDRDTRARQAHTLRALADFLESGHGPRANYLDDRWHVWCFHSKDDVAKLARDAARAGWAVEKVYDDLGDGRKGKLDKLRVTPPGGNVMEALGAGVACTPVVVGTHEVDEIDWTAPQPPVPARPTRKVTRDKIEYRCDPLLAGNDVVEPSYSADAPF